MKSIFILVLISFLFVNVYSQKKMTGRELAGLKGNVKSVANYEIVFFSDDDLTSLDAESFLTTQEFYYKNGKVKNNPRKPYLSANIKYAYDLKGRIIEERKFYNLDFLSEFGNFFKIGYKYNSKGQISERIWYENDQVTENIYETYDAKGNLIESKFVPTEFNKIQGTSILRFKKYKFDSRGNWIQRTQTAFSVSDGGKEEIQSITYRKIEYYK